MDREFDILKWRSKHVLSEEITSAVKFKRGDIVTMKSSFEKRGRQLVPFDNYESAGTVISCDGSTAVVRWDSKRTFYPDPNVNASDLVKIAKAL